MTARVQWQVQYFERGVEYWWNYPPEVCTALEAIKDVVVDDVFCEWVYVCPAKRTRRNPSGTFVTFITKREGPQVGATYRLYPKRMVQVNTTGGIERERSMQRVVIESGGV